MPIRELRCANCDEEFEQLELPSDEGVIPTCPACGSPDVERMISAPTPILKGDGWARDGYAYPKKP